MADRHFGNIAGIDPGATYPDRESVAKSGLHRPIRAGISGSGKEGADSIVLSGGYEDDEDFGDVIIYTGHGGRDPNSGQQVADQELTRQNLALAVSCQQGLPVRVIRGAKHDSPLSPSTGYQYAGLFRIEEYWHEVGQAGHRVWRYRLVQLEADGPPGRDTPTATPVGGSTQPRRTVGTVTRVIRDTAISQ